MICGDALDLSLVIVRIFKNFTARLDSERFRIEMPCKNQMLFYDINLMSFDVTSDNMCNAGNDHLKMCATLVKPLTIVPDKVLQTKDRHCRYTIKNTSNYISYFHCFVCSNAHTPP